MYPFFLFVLSLLLISCSNPQAGPDKTAAGALLGAGWGAGTGAIIGNQIGHQGEGVAVGAGVGAVHGALQGVGYDLGEDALLDQQQELEALRVSNEVNQRRLQGIQQNLDSGRYSSHMGGVYQVFFDVDATNLRPGAIAHLEVIADTLLRDSHAMVVSVVGHSDDSGNPEYNARLAEARARNVSSYLAARGLSLDQIKVSSHGAKRPIASNETAVGRQLNRRVDVYVSSKANS